MSKPKMPEWLQLSRSYRLLIEAAEAAYSLGCDCKTCELLREWAATAPPPSAPTLPEGVKGGKRRGT